MTRPQRVDIDRLAREAKRDLEKKPDLLKEGFPYEPAWIWIVIEPRAPKTMSAGGIHHVEVSQTAETYQASIGRVLKAGPASMDGKTTSGIDICKFLPGITTREQLIGKWVFYQQHTGQRLRLAKTDQMIIVMKVTDLLGSTEDPDAWRFYL